MALIDKLTALGDAIRVKTGGTEPLTLDQMASDLNAISNRTSSDLTESGATVTVPAGNYKTQATKSIVTATQATPSVSIDSSGLITASATQTAGYVSAGTKSGTKQLTTKAAATITPTTSNQTIAAGTYLTGVQTIAGDADLKAVNIKKGVNIFGVAGSYDATSETLNFKVVGGTSAPSSPAANTIWVNTSTSITSWVFSATQPSGSNGMVWFSVGTSSTAKFNALKKNGIEVYPIRANQYVNGAWVGKTAKTYQSGKWVDWATSLYKAGDVNTAGWSAYDPSYSNHTLTFGTYMVLTIPDSSGMGRRTTFHTDMLDLKNAKTLSITMKNTNNVTIGIASAYSTSTTWKTSRSASAQSDFTTHTFDVSAIDSGMVALRFEVNAYKTGLTATFESVYLT